MKKYSLLLQWSEEDKCYLATCPEFKHLLNMGGGFTHGDTWKETAEMAEEAMTLVIESFESDNTPLPEPQLYKWNTNGAES